MLPRTVFTADNLPKLSNGKTVTQNFSYAPAVYRLFTISPYIFGTMLVLFLASTGLSLMSEFAQNPIFNLSGIMEGKEQRFGVFAAAGMRGGELDHRRARRAEPAKALTRR